MNRILSKLPIGLKLGGSFVVIVLILAASITLSYSNMSRMNSGMMGLYFDHTIPIQNLGEAQALLGQIKSNLQLYLQIPEPKTVAGAAQNGPICGTCHIPEVSGTHHVSAGQPASDTNRCLACHATQASDKLHGRSTASITAGQNCASCHPAEVITQQHTQVEQAITDEVNRVDEIIAAYRKNSLLTNEEKTALDGFDNAWNKYKFIVVGLLGQAKSGNSQETLHRIVGGDALTSQQEVESAINLLVTINQDLAHKSQENGVQTFNASTLSLLIAGLLGILLAAGLGLAITSNIRAPIEAMAQGLQNMRQGNLSWNVSAQVKASLIERSDELGVAGKGFDSTVRYLQEMAELANQIATGDLTVKVTPRGEADEFGIAFSKMVASLQTLLDMVSQSADNLTLDAEKLATASEQSGEAASQIATTIQQVTLGIIQQSENVSRTANSVENLNSAIGSVATGAQDQSVAIGKAAQVATQINSAISQVTDSAQAVANNSAEAARYSRDGAKTVKETISGMDTIRNKVGLSATKVAAMGDRSEEIGAIVETIEDIASQTNLLALNATIEAARTEGSGKQANEKLAQTHLVSVAKMLAELLSRSSSELNSQELSRLSQHLNVEILSISDADGVIVNSSQPDALGFRFPETGQGQAAAFRSLLGQNNGVVVQPIMARDDNGKPYLFVGVSRQDKPGIIQTGMPAQELLQFENISRGFAVVADEVRKLADRSSMSTKEIAKLIKGIQKTVNEAVSAMKESADEVEAGVARANSAGEALNNILTAVESVYKQAGDAGTAAAQVSAAASELIGAVDTVSAVIEDNTAATEEMSANSSELTQAIENIASVSEENSAAIEEVSAATQEVSAQVTEVSTSAASLMGLAHELQQVVRQFKISAEPAAQPVEQIHQSAPMKK